jgi:probable rRNA maturation factor
MVHIHIAEHIYPEGDAGRIDLQNLQRAAQKTLEYLLPQEQVDCSIVLTDDAGIQDYNKRYRQVNKPTDVLSFPADTVDPDVDRRYLGDVIISYPRAAAQARSGNHPIDEELQLLVVHGVLHLGGYDHLLDEERARMTAAQSEVFSRLGLDISPPQM